MTPLLIILLFAGVVRAAEVIPSREWPAGYTADIKWDHYPSTTPARTYGLQTLEYKCQEPDCAEMLRGIKFTTTPAITQGGKCYLDQMDGKCSIFDWNKDGYKFTACLTHERIKVFKYPRREVKEGR